MMNKTKWSALLLGSLLLAAPAAAETVKKLGFINTERIYQEANQAQRMVKDLETEFASRRKELEKMHGEGLALEQKVAKMKAGAERDRQFQALAEMTMRFRLAEARLAEEYDLRRSEEFAALQQSADKALLLVAQKGGYDLILKEVLYIDSKFDITDEVIREMNRH